MGQAELLDTAAEIYGLTGREREVMKLVYDGLSNPDIAKDLSITLSTVKGHIHNIFEKMGVSNRIELIHCINAQTAPLKLTQHTKIEKTSRSDG